MTTAKPQPPVSSRTVKSIRPGDTLDKHHVTRVEHCSTDYSNLHIHCDSGDGGTRVWCFDSATEVERVASGQFVTLRVA